MVLGELRFPPVVLMHCSVVFVEFVRVNEELIVDWLLWACLMILFYLVVRSLLQILQWDYLDVAVTLLMSTGGVLLRSP